jgi:hypothetical protein
MRTFLASLAFLAFLAVPGLAEIKFEDVKGGSKSDPLGKGELLSFRLLFNNLSATGNKAFGGMAGLNPTVGVFYTREGKELAFSAYGDFGIGTGLDQTTTPRTAVSESRSFLAEWGVDLNYIMSNSSQFFWSAGLAEHSHWGGILIEQTNTRFTMVPVINLMGFNTRARFYPLQEFFLTGYFGFSFIPIYSRELQGYHAGTPAVDPGQTAVDAEAPFTWVFEFSGEYRPIPGFAFHGGLRYRALTYKAADPSNAGVATAKSLTYFSPFFGVTLLY